MTDIYFYRRIDQDEYYIPKHLVEEFDSLRNKINSLAFQETKRGYEIVFSGKFNAYRVNLQKGKIFEKKVNTPNSPRNKKGEKVKITEIDGDFVRYQKVRRFLWLWIATDIRLTLNKISFLRIYGEVS